MSNITNVSDLRTLTGDTGGPVFPVSGNIDIVGGAGIDVAGSAGTLTISASGTVAGTYEADSGSATPALGVLKIIGFAGDHILTTGSGNEIEIALSGFVENAVVVGNAGGGLSSIVPAIDGEILIGASGDTPEFASLQSSSGTVSFTPGPNSLDVNVVGGGMTWSTVAINTSMESDSGYVTAAASQIELLLPLTSDVGSVLKIIDSGQAGSNSPYRITQRANQYIAATLQLVSTVGVGGYVQCAASADEKFAATTLRCIVADTAWVVESSTGLLQFN